MELLTATDLDEWSKRRDAQAHLPTLVRRLIMATVAPSSIRVPAAEGVSAHGFDGIVEVVGGAPPFIPSGRSVWEMGTDQDPKRKAEKDYKKRTEETPEAERAATTFVFVTSRTWHGAHDWAESKDGWAGVVALDAQDLATWLETCPGIQGWLASERLGRQPFGITALREWFLDWSERTEPAIPAALLLCGRKKEAGELVAQLGGPAAEQHVTTQSREEAVAFVAGAFLADGGEVGTGSTGRNGGPETDDAGGDRDDADFREALLERALVVYDGAAWRRWAAHEQPLILIPLFDDPPVDAAVRAGHHVVLPRTARPGDAALPSLDRTSARAVWESAGVGFPQDDDLARAARRTLTSLRRRIGRTGRFRQPAWAEGPSANLLATLLLAGSWTDDVDGDKNVITALADRGWRSVARDLAPLKLGDDAPLVERGHRWEFVDIVDAWDALSPTLTSEDLEVFHQQVLPVLTEGDPLLGLTSEEPPTRALTPEGLPHQRHSPLLRRGMANTLAVLGAVAAGRVLPGGRTGDQHAATAVRSLLIGADSVRWQSVSDLLPTLAEAAPDVFLDAVEAALRAADAPVMALFHEEDAGLGPSFSSRHTSLLWALEGLAFSPRHVSRVAVVLAELAKRDPGGRLANRPAESLKSVLHLVFPQSAVDQATRLQIIDAVRHAAPDIAWMLMLSLITSTERGMILARGPRFRDWPRPPEGLSYPDLVATLDALADRLAEDADADGERWTDALRLVDKLPPAGRERLLTAADDAWPGLEQDIQRKVMVDLGERINRHTRFRDAHWALSDDSLRRLQQFADDHAVPGLEPGDQHLFSWFPERESFDTQTEEGRAALSHSQ